MSDENNKLGKPLEALNTFTLNKGKLTTTGATSSFRERVKANKDKAEQEAAGADEYASVVPNRICLMLDCSGSMYGDSMSDLHSACVEFINACNFSDTALAIHTFGKTEELRGPLSRNATVLHTLTSQLPAEGGTPMWACVVQALENISMTRGLLVSDGAATDWHDDAILDSYKNASTPIDCVFIGEGSGDKLLQRIAERTGGLFIKFSKTGNFARAFKYLAPSNRALLGDGSMLRNLGAEVK